VNDRSEGYDYPARVRFEIQERDIHSYRRAADWLNFNNADVLCIQHEFGIYGGPSGSHLLALLKEVRMPVVTTLHTILQQPNDQQRRVIDELIRRSARVVVMAEKGAEILQSVYGAPSEKTVVIPHGIPDVPRHRSAEAKEQFGVGGRQVLLTFGLLGPGKGIEHVIEALPQIISSHPDVVYIVLGATHPQLLAREGERYRISLEWLAEERGVKDHVIFYNRFVTSKDLVEFIRATDIYITPYLNEAQITSGTLAQVFGAGKAVISTPYWHARELLADGRGTLVPFADSAAIARAATAWLQQPAELERVQLNAWRHGRTMIWPTVARRYLDSFTTACAEKRSLPRTAFGGWTAATRPYELPQRRLDHIIRMSDGTGIFQHALYSVPDFQHGYCTDDNARAFLLCNLLDALGDSASAENVSGLSSTYLAFLNAALEPGAGRFRNFLGFDRRWLETCGSEDSHGRALWALGTGAARSASTGQRRLSAHLFEAGLASVSSFTSPRAWAFSLLGLHEFLQVFPDHRPALAARDVLTGDLLQLWNNCATADWPWFESSVTYDNARLSQALLQSGHAQSRPEAVDAGLTSLRWLTSIQKTQAGCFRPIGSNGFYPRDGARADFDQQPVEAQAMVSACLDAFRITGDPMWSKEARRAFEWFLGRNDLGLPLYDPAAGGCGDGLHHDRVNENQGAESTLAFHLALAEMVEAEHQVPISAP
jgi:glycosyltransferase involved in cell wall biosynthesis